MRTCVYEDQKIIKNHGTILSTRLAVSVNNMGLRDVRLPFFDYLF